MGKSTTDPMKKEVLVSNDARSAPVWLSLGGASDRAFVRDGGGDLDGCYKFVRNIFGGSPLSSRTRRALLMFKFTILVS